MKLPLPLLYPSCYMERWLSGRRHVPAKDAYPFRGTEGSNPSLSDFAPQKRKEARQQFGVRGGFEVRSSADEPARREIPLLEPEKSLSQQLDG